MIRSVLPRIATAATLLLFVACADTGDEDQMAETAETPAPEATTPAPAPAGEMGAESGMMDPNAATRDQLMQLPNMDGELADALIAGRPYDNMTGVDKVLAGKLSEEQRDQVYAMLWKPINLNTAGDEEILLIPGIGNRMLREFKEYRPYTAIEQFRREMGKYVDDAEVARMEKYVSVPQ